MIDLISKHFIILRLLAMFKLNYTGLTNLLHYCAMTCKRPQLLLIPFHYIQLLHCFILLIILIALSRLNYTGLTNLQRYSYHMRDDLQTLPLLTRQSQNLPTHELHYKKKKKKKKLHMLIKPITIYHMGTTCKLIKQISHYTGLFMHFSWWPLLELLKWYPIISLTLGPGSM